jgi:hypothetical protein
METESYIIMKRSTAVTLSKLLNWLTILLEGAGPSWHKHALDLRIARLDLDNAIDMSERASARARYIA